MSNPELNHEAYTPKALLEQCSAQCSQGEVLLAGSLGRATHIGDFREFAARGEALHVTSKGEPRDIDLITPDGLTPVALGGFPLDTEVFADEVVISKGNGSWTVYDRRVDMGTEIHEDVFAPEARLLGDHLVSVPNGRTLHYLCFILGHQRPKDRLATTIFEEALQGRGDLLPQELFGDLDIFLAERNKKLIIRMQSLYRSALPEDFRTTISPMVRAAKQLIGKPQV